MSHRSRRASRLIAAGILVAFLASWVLPAQACSGLVAAAQQSGCPDCPSPCCQHDCGGAATMCAASMLTTAAAPAAWHQAALVPAALTHSRFRLRAAENVTAPPERPPAYSTSSTLSIRFCSFQN